MGNSRGNTIMMGVTPHTNHGGALLAGLYNYHGHIEESKLIISS